MERQDFSNSQKVRHTGGNYPHVGMMEFPRMPFSELHLAKFPDFVEFQSWEATFKTAVCAKTANPQVTTSWSTEVEKAKSIDELKTSRSILGRTDFLDYKIFDVLIASALKKILNSEVEFLKRISIEEQRALKDDQFLPGRQIAFMIYEHFLRWRHFRPGQVFPVILFLMTLLVTCLPVRSS